MIRLMLAMIIAVGAVYMLFVKQTPEEKPATIYQKNIDQAKSLEQQMLKDAERVQEKVDKLMK